MKKKKKRETYKCQVCKGTFEKGWSDEEAAQEFKDTKWRTGVSLEETGLVCDDCYDKMTAWLRAIGELPYGD